MTFVAKVREIFVLMIIQFHRNESSWNVRSRGTKVPRERMFHGTKVLGTFAPEERELHGSASSKERMFHGGESSTGAKVLSMVFSLPGTKVQRNEKAWNRHFVDNYICLNNRKHRNSFDKLGLLLVLLSKYLVSYFLTV